MDAKVDFCLHKNLTIACSSIIISTGLGVRGFTAGGVNVSGLAFGTVLAVLLNLVLLSAERRKKRTTRTTPPMQKAPRQRLVGVLCYALKSSRLFTSMTWNNHLVFVSEAMATLDVESLPRILTETLAVLV